ncbi:PHP domain-containing protein [Coprobacillus sp. OF03-2AA]|nr:PHP domain-containing protein [Coprobacillus sp. OF03-2AA]
MIQLNVKTEYSILNSIVKVKDVIDKAKRNNMSSLAITDINNLHMAFTFQNLCKKQGIHPILGLCLLLKVKMDIICLPY